MLGRALQRMKHIPYPRRGQGTQIQQATMASAIPSTLVSQRKDRSYSAAIEALNTLQSNAATIAAIRAVGGKHSDWLIPEMVEYLKRAGHSQRELDGLNVIHIAGTKGKGSTAAFTNALLLRAFHQTNESRQGPRIGLYTSPHMLLVRERIRLDGIPISEDQFANAFWHVWDAFEKTSDSRARPEITPARPVYFKFLTVMAFHVFLSVPSLLAVVLEVGIGGRYDSTNIVPRPAACGITTLGLDHQAVLGHTIEEIAAQKAGIYKRDVAAITVSQPFKQTEDILRSVAEDVGASSFTVLPPAETTPVASIPLSLSGPHQTGNALLAVELVDSYLKSQNVPKPAQSPSTVWQDPAKHELESWATQALAEVRWPGRFQIVPLPFSRPGTIYFLDGAHTPDSLALCASWFIEQSPFGQTDLQRTLIFNCTMGRKARGLLAAMLEPIRAAWGTKKPLMEATRYFDRVFFCTNTTYRPSSGAAGGDLVNKMVDSTELQTLAVQRELRDAWLELSGGKANVGASVEVLPSIEDAMAAVPLSAKQKQHVLVAGSLHLVGGVMSHLKEAGALNDDLEAVVDS